MNKLLGNKNINFNKLRKKYLKKTLRPIINDKEST